MEPNQVHSAAKALAIGLLVAALAGAGLCGGVLAALWMSVHGN